MGKKARFPLDMGNDIKVTTIEALKENYNAEKVTEYFLNGKLLTWLEDRYYDEEAEQVRELDQQSGNNPAAKLAKIFGVEINESVDVEALEIRREKLEKLREITSEDEILDNVDHVAFSQEELGELLDDEVEVIYLCGESFRIPLSVKNVRYVGVNDPAVTISGKGEVDLEANGIIIERCELPEEIKGKITESVRNTDSEYKIKVYVPKQTSTVKDNNTVLAAEYGNETKYIYFRRVSKRNYMYNPFSNYNECISIFSHSKKGGHYGDNAAPISKTEVYDAKEEKKRVYIKNNPNSVFEIFKNQMLEALDNLPKEFIKDDGFVDLTDSETIAAVDEAVRIYIEKYDFNQNDTDDDDDYDDDDYDDDNTARPTAKKPGR